jgi:hypothetical protein
VNVQQIKAMLVVNAIMVSVFVMVKAFQLIYEMQHIILSFDLIKNMLMIKEENNETGMAHAHHTKCQSVRR